MKTLTMVTVCIGLGLLIVKLVQARPSWRIDVYLFTLRPFELCHLKIFMLGNRGSSSCVYRSYHFVLVMAGIVSVSVTAPGRKQ